MSRLRCMDLVTIAINAEIAGKIYVLATNTMSDPSNDSADTMAVNLLSAALDAALAVHDGSTGVVDLNARTIKLALVAPLAGTSKKKGGPKQ